jgi:hypothetical protein
MATGKSGEDAEDTEERETEEEREIGKKMGSGGLIG